MLLIGRKVSCANGLSRCSPLLNAKFTVRQISRMFQKLFFEPSMWNVFDTNRARRIVATKNSLNRMLVGRILQRCGSAVKTLRITDIHADTVGYITDRCANLKELSLLKTRADVVWGVVNNLSLDGVFIKVGARPNTPFLNRSLLTYFIVQLRRLDITMDNYRVQSLTVDTVDSLLALIGTSCPNLRGTLFCPRESANLIAILNRLMLLELHFMSNGFIHANGLRSLLNGCHNLESLSLSSCHILSDEDIRLFTTYPCASLLKYLCLSQFTNATDAALARIGSGCPRLEVFLIHHGLGITDRGLQSLAASCTKLKWLKVQGCRNVSLGALDTDFESNMGCPIIYSPEFPVGLGLSFRRKG